MSVAAGMPTWPNLLRDIAKELGLDVARETDLVALAQYHVNKNRLRSQLNQRIVDEYDRPVEIPENHRLLANLPVEIFWTTNYDRLIERALAAAGRRCEVKIR